MSFWFDVFTRETWAEARAVGLTVTGFSEKKRATAARVQPDDILLCYLKGYGKLVGALRVSGESYFAHEPVIWRNHAFRVRLPVVALIALDPPDGLSLAHVLPQLSFYDPTNVKRMYARFQGSPTLLLAADGEILFGALRGTLTAVSEPVSLTESAGENPSPPPDDAPVPPSGPIRFADPVERLAAEIAEAQRDAGKPSRFEQAVATALAFLGLDVKRVGGSGETDVLVESPLGHDRFRIVVDTKASGGGKIAENQINWPAIADHQRRARANHAAVVGERFAGGNLQGRAAEFGVALLDTQSLVDVLRLHATAPFPAADLRPLFATAGPVTGVVADLRQKAEATERHWQLVAEIVRLADAFSRFEPPPTLTPGSLHVVLVDRALSKRGERGAPPSEQDVREAVGFLSSRAVGVLRAIDPDTAGYRLTMSLAAALQRIGALRTAISGALDIASVSEDASRAHLR